MRTFRRLAFSILLTIACIYAAWRVGYAQGAAILTVPVDAWRLHEVEQKTDLLTLQQITAGAKDDTEALDSIRTYYLSKRDYLASFWQETNEQRLQSLYIMYVVHISHHYGETPNPATTLLDYIRTQPRSHCGWYSHWQAVIYTHFGLNWRDVAFDSGAHGWIEVKIGETWELFDSTINVWIDRTSFALLGGVERHYRTFWTPLHNSEDAVDHTYTYSQHYDVPKLRALMPALGLHWRPPAALVIQDEAVTVQRYP